MVTNVGACSLFLLYKSISLLFLLFNAITWAPLTTIVHSLETINNVEVIERTNQFLLRCMVAYSIRSIGTTLIPKIRTSLKILAPKC